MRKEKTLKINDYTNNFWVLEKGDRGNASKKVCYTTDQLTTCIYAKCLD